MMPRTTVRPGSPHFWNTLAQRTDNPVGDGDVWRGLERYLTLATTLPAPVTGLLDGLTQRTDPTLYCPQAIPDVAEEQVVEAGQTLTVICSPRGRYLQLPPIQRELWHMMDGTRTINQLAVHVLMTHGQLAPIGEFVQQLKREGFLVERPVNIYTTLESGLEQRTAEGWGRRVLRTLASQTWHIPNIDAIYTSIYRTIGWVFFTPLFYVIWALVIVAGLIAFGSLFQQGIAPTYEILSLNGSVLLGLAALWAMLLVSFVLHESSHALAVKHYRRILHGGGIMLYYGMPAAFIDTSDIWRSPRRARIFVSAAGPMSDLLVGSLASIAALVLASSTSEPQANAIGALLFKLAVTCYIAVLFNANPLLELDGYFILVDLLRMPELRQRALAFVSGPLWRKLLAPARSPFTREDRILTLYGGLTIAYTIFAIIAAIAFWQRQLQQPITALLSGAWWEQLIAWLLILLVIAPIIIAAALTAWGTVRAAVAWLVQRGYGRRPELLTIVGVLVTLGLGALTIQLPTPYNFWVAPLLWALALSAQLALQADYRGAAIAPSLSGLLLATVCATLAIVLRALGTPLWIIPEALAFVLLLLAGFGALLDVELRFVPAAELLSTAILLILAFAAGGLALVLAEQSWPTASRAFHIVASAPAYFGALALALMLPRLFDLRDSRLIWSWVLLWAGVLAETISYLVNLIQPIPALDVLVAGLWVAAWLTHLATLRQITPDEITWEHVTSLSEGQRLARAFQYTYAGCYRLLREVYGERRARAFDDRMDVIAATAGWDVTLDRDQARIGATVEKLPLDEQGTRFAEVLRYTVLMIEEITGHVFARRAIQSAYDALPWPERETANRLCIPDTPWARELSSSFGDTRSSRLRLLRQVELFTSCDDDELAALAHTIHEQRVGPDTILLRSGHQLPGVWIIEAGEVLMLRDSKEINELHRGDAFGAHELLEGRPSDATYKTTVSTMLLFIPASEYQGLSQSQAPHAAEAIESSAVVRLLERVPLFAELPRNTLRGLAHIVDRRQVGPKTVVVRQGMPSGVFYIIQHGQAAIITREQRPDGTTSVPRIVATIGPKEFFGELELLHGTPPVANVLTTTTTVLLALPHDAIRALLLGDGGMAKSLEQIGTGRLLSLRG